MARRSRKSGVGKARRGEAGNTAVMAGIMILMLLGFASLVVDVGYVFRVRNELQNAADSAALAGAMQLNRKSSGLSGACDKAKSFSASHQGNNTAVALEDADIEFGHWYFAGDSDAVCSDGRPGAPCFQSLGTCATPPDANAAAVNAVHVTTRRSQATKDEVNLYFGVFVGSPTADVGAKATAVGGAGPRDACAFPVALPSCAMQDADGKPTCPDKLCFGGGCDPENAALTNLSPNKDPPVNGNNVHPLVEKALNGECTKIDTGGEIQLQNGNDPSKDTIDLINDKLADGPIFVEVPVIQWPDCSKTNINQSEKVLGFVRIQITGANWTSGQPKKVIFATTVCDQDSGGLTGGEYFGLSAPRPWLVR